MAAPEAPEVLAEVPVLEPVPVAPVEAPAPAAEAPAPAAEAPAEAPTAPPLGAVELAAPVLDPLLKRTAPAASWVLDGGAGIKMTLPSPGLTALLPPVVVLVDVLPVAPALAAAEGATLLVELPPVALAPPVALVPPEVVLVDVPPVPVAPVADVDEHVALAPAPAPAAVEGAVLANALVEGLAAGAVLAAVETAGAALVAGATLPLAEPPPPQAARATAITPATGRARNLIMCFSDASGRIVVCLT